MLNIILPEQKEEILFVSVKDDEKSNGIFNKKKENNYVFSSREIELGRSLMLKDKNWQLISKEIKKKIKYCKDLNIKNDMILEYHIILNIKLKSYLDNNQKSELESKFSKRLQIFHSKF
jgi:flagellar biosynthesis/type III secretory pathway chaperone